jgi:hypothetical protein
MENTAAFLVETWSLKNPMYDVFGTRQTSQRADVYTWSLFWNHFP